MRTNTKLLVAALLAVVTFAGAVSIIQTSAYVGSAANGDQLRQGTCAQCQGTDANAYPSRRRAMTQCGEPTGNAYQHCHRHGSDG